MSKREQHRLADYLRRSEHGPHQQDEAAAQIEEYLRLCEVLASLGSRAEPSAGAFERGRMMVRAALGEPAPPSRLYRGWVLAPAAVKAAAIVGAALLLSGGAAGASSALGGPNIAGNALSAVGLSREKAPAAADKGLDTAERAIDDALDIAR
jgi:hypothetical protein